MDRKRIVLAILTSACLAASMLVGSAPSNAQINGFGTSTSGGSRRPDRSHQLYRNLWVELGGGVRWPCDGAYQLRNAGVWFEHCRGIRRKTNRTNYPDLTAVRRDAFLRHPAAKTRFWCPSARQRRRGAKRVRSEHLHTVLNLKRGVVRIG